jgi:hypothetical protein
MLGGQLSKLDQLDNQQRRSAALKAAQLAPTTSRMMQADIDILRGVAKEQQERAQAEVDAPKTAVQEIFNLMKQAPQTSTTVQSGGGK